MLRVGDPVWHEQFGSGHLAKTSGATHWVMFDNSAYNMLVSTAPPSTEKYIDKISGREKTRVTGPAPLDDKVIYWDKPASDMPEQRPSSAKQQEPFKYPNKPGYFTVLKVGQAFSMRYDEKTKELKFAPREGIVEIRIENNETGEKFKVRVDGSEDPAFPTARKMASETISGLTEGKDALW